jgi:hypothetical protein
MELILLNTYLFLRYNSWNNLFLRALNHYRVEKIKSATSQGLTNRLSYELFISISERGLITDKCY